MGKRLCRDCLGHGKLWRFLPFLRPICPRCNGTGIESEAASKNVIRESSAVADSVEREGGRESPFEARDALVVMARNPRIAAGCWREYRIALTLEDADRIIDEAETRPSNTEYRVAVERKTLAWLCDACGEPTCLGHGGWDEGER